MKHLLKLGGMTPEEILHILDVADEYKRLHKDGVDPKDLQGKAVALVFAKNSTRTRTSLEVGIYQMGGLGTYLSAGDLQTARGEPVQDTARVLGRYYDAIVCRTYKQTTLDMLAKYSGIPVVSGMTDYAHPLQVLTDLMTVRERKGTLAGLKAGFVGDGYNMANSVIVGCLAVGMTVTIACPKGYRPAADVLMLAKQYGDKFTLTNDPDEAARDADVLFTDVWVSMGMEREAEQRRRDFTGFTLDAARMALAKPGCIYYQGDHSPNEAERADRGYSSAWLHHKGRNKHHLEYWIDYSTRKAGLAGMKMPLRYVCEMVCDRVAASRIYLGDKYTDASPWEYYERSKNHYLMHPETRALLEKLLKMVRDLGQDRTFAYMKFLLGCQKDY